MSGAPKTEKQHKKDSLWLIAVSPTIWSAHFLVSYATAAVYCAKFADPDGSLNPVRVAIAVYTAVALAGIGFVGWLGWRRQRAGDMTVPHDSDTPEDRHRFLGFATLLLSGLSAVGTIYEALPAVFMETCR